MTMLETLQTLQKGHIVRLDRAKMPPLYGEFQGVETFDGVPICHVGRQGVFVIDIERLTVYTVKMIKDTP